MISIIIPLYNEEKMLFEHSSCLKDLSCLAELIFVDGASSDRTIEPAKQFGRVLQSQKGRAIQMNYGAGYAKGDILLFLHADSIISVDALACIEKKISEDGYVGGCLTQRIDNDVCIYRAIEAQGNLRARATKVFYGDQGIFVKKGVFVKMGGFPEVPIMEDVLFTRKLRRLGKTVVLSDKIIVSARRWEKKGIIRTMLLYNLLIILFWLKVPLDKIKKLYEETR